MDINNLLIEKIEKKQNKKILLYNDYQNDKYLMNVYNNMIIKLFEYENYFYKTGKKIKFTFLDEYFRICSNLRCHKFVSPKIKLFSKYNNQIYYIEIAEILDRFININGYYEKNKINNVTDMLTNFDTTSMVYSIKDTGLFIYIVQNLCDILKYINIDIPEFKDRYDQTIHNFINVYIYTIINKSSDDKFIHGEIELVKNVIDCLLILKYYKDIIEITKHLAYYKNYFTKTNKVSQTIFCDRILKYISIDLNIVETVEFNNDLKFLEFNTVDYNKYIESITHDYTFNSDYKGRVDYYAEPDDTCNIVICAYNYKKYLY